MRDDLTRGAGLRGGRRQRRGGVAAWLLALALPAMAATTATPPSPAAAPRSATSAPAAASLPSTPGMSAQVVALQRWLRQSRDHAGHPYIVIDKRNARLWAFDAGGRLAGSTPVLLGWARGDASVPGIGERPIKSILPHERTTPAGRFLAEPGHNAKGEDILWVDYDAAVSMHRVRAVNPAERRLERLASATPADNRISYGCINVPVAFYEQRILPLLGSARPVVYLLPETLPLDALFTGASAAATPPTRRAPRAAPATPTVRAPGRVASRTDGRTTTRSAPDSERPRQPS